MSGSIATPPAIRFARFFERSGGCWNWLGGLFKETGYGKFNAGKGENGKTITAYAHRVSYELHTGPIPEGMQVLHRCDNPRCVRPDHLFLGTQLDNMRDMIAKGRHDNGGWQSAARERQSHHVN